MTKVEELALEIFPKNSLEFLRTGRDFNGYRRQGFIKGYEQAEKDLSLTPDDIKLITKIHYEIIFKDTTGIKAGDVAAEVLTRFKQIKEAKKNTKTK